MDRGTVSFVKDGDDFNMGRPVVVNMGIAYHHLRRVGRNDASGRNGLAMYPCFGVKAPGDQMTVRGQKWLSRRGLGHARRVRQAVDAIVAARELKRSLIIGAPPPVSLVEGARRRYRNWRRGRFSAYPSRAGVSCEVDVTPTALRRAEGGVAEGFGGLRVGQKVETPHGEGKILGSLRSDVWFSLDGDDSGAWYWTREELSDLLNSASVRLVEGSGVDASGGGGGGGNLAQAEGEVAVGAATAPGVDADGSAEADANANVNASTSADGGANAGTDADAEAAVDPDAETAADTNASANANANTAVDSASAVPAPAPAVSVPETATSSHTEAATSSSVPPGGREGAPSGDAGTDGADADLASAAGAVGSARCGAREFTALATEGWGSLALDEALVRVANVVAGRRGVPPSHLSEGELAAAVEAAGPGLGGSALASISAEKLGARLLLLVELNARLAVALPLLDLARECKAPLAVTKSDLRRAAVVPGVSLGVGSPSGAAVADLRGLLFTQTKVRFGGGRGMVTSSSCSILSKTVRASLLILIPRPPPLPPFFFMSRSLSCPPPHTHTFSLPPSPRYFFISLPPPSPHIIVGLGWHRRCKTLYVYWGWRWLATTL